MPGTELDGFGTAPPVDAVSSLKLDRWSTNCCRFGCSFICLPPPLLFSKNRCERHNESRLRFGLLEGRLSRGGRRPRRPHSRGPAAAARGGGRRRPTRLAPP